MAAFKFARREGVKVILEPLKPQRKNGITCSRGRCALIGNRLPYSNWPTTKPSKGSSTLSVEARRAEWAEAERLADELLAQDAKAEAAKDAAELKAWHDAFDAEERKAEAETLELATKKHREEEDQRKRHAEGKERDARTKREGEERAAKREAHLRRLCLGGTFPDDD